MPPGFFGTRADLLADAVLVVNCIAPFWAWAAARVARAGRHELHRTLQISLCALAFVALFSLEGSIRINGGSGSLVAESPFAGTTELRVAFILHIGPAVATYLFWLWLTIKSVRSFKRDLPGSFGRTHVRAGWAVMAGLIWTAGSALVVYWLGFVATSPTAS